MSRPILLILTGLAGCTGPDPVPRAKGTTSPPATTPSELEGPSPVWDADAAVSALAAIPELPLAGQVLDAYLDAMAWGDDNCPGSETQMAGITFTGCTASSGVLYWGIADYRDESEVDGDTVRTRTALGADFEIVFVDGRHFEAGGSAGLGLEEAAGRAAVWHSEVKGTWWDTSREGALGAGVSSTLAASASADGGEVVLEGGVGMGDLAVAFSDVRFPVGCDDQPIGTFRVRDPVGYWYSLEFPEPCGSCAKLGFGDTSLGESCVDLRAIAGLVRSGFGI